MKNTKRNYTNIEVKVAVSECFLDAQKFFEDAGVHFLNSRREHRYGLSILVDDSLKRPMAITPFSFGMSRNMLAGLYVQLVKNERMGGHRRIQSLIKVLDKVIKDGYKNGSLLSHNIETGKYTTKSREVIHIFAEIFEHAFVFSLGGDTVEHVGDIYSLLGGETGTYQFFKEVMLATEASIPNIEDKVPDVIIGHIPNIRCYTCKYCKVDGNGVRTCTNTATLLDADVYTKDPTKYGDAHHSDTHEGLVSSVIDDRMNTCEDYIPRIK